MPFFVASISPWFMWIHKKIPPPPPLEVKPHIFSCLANQRHSSPGNAIKYLLGSHDKYSFFFRYYNTKYHNFSSLRTRLQTGDRISAIQVLASELSHHGRWINHSNEIPHPLRYSRLSIHWHWRDLTTFTTTYTPSRCTPPLWRFDPNWRCLFV